MEFTPLAIKDCGAGQRRSHLQNCWLQGRMVSLPGSQFLLLSGQPLRSGASDADQRSVCRNGEAGAPRVSRLAFAVRLAQICNGVAGPVRIGEKADKGSATLPK